MADDQCISVPRGIYMRGDTWWGNFSIGGMRVRRSLKTSDLEVATARYQDFLQKCKANLDIAAGLEPPPAIAEEHQWLAHLDELGRSWRTGWLYRVFENTKRRAAKKKIPFTLIYDDLLHIARRSNGKCEVTGARFSLWKPSGARASPFAPSVDRIDWRKGYEIKNCRLVCYAANLAMSQWGVGPLEIMLAAYCRKKYGGGGGI